VAARKTRKPTTEAVDDQEFEKQMLKEERGFRRRKKSLLKKFDGEFIAFYKGEVVDHDADYSMLVQRVRQKFGRVPILFTPVRRKPILFQTPMGILEWG